MTDIIETNEVELTLNELVIGAFENNVKIADLPNEVLGAFIREIAGTSTIAEQFKDENDKKVTRVFNLAAVDFPLIAIKRMLEYGMQRLPNDSVSGWDDYAGTEMKMNAVAALLIDLKNGIVKKARQSAKPITNLTTLARKKAKAYTKIQYDSEDGLDWKVDFLDSQTLAEQNTYLDSVIAIDDQFIIAAQAEIDGVVEAKKSIDLSKLPKRKS